LCCGFAEDDVGDDDAEGVDCEYDPVTDNVHIYMPPGPAR
jgi:hypothetical protein